MAATKPLSSMTNAELDAAFGECHSEAARLCTRAGMSTENMRAVLEMLNLARRIGVQDGTRWTQKNRGVAA